MSFKGHVCHSRGHNSAKMTWIEILYPLGGGGGGGGGGRGGEGGRRIYCFDVVLPSTTN